MLRCDGSRRHVPRSVVSAMHGLTQLAWNCTSRNKDQYCRRNLDPSVNHHGCRGAEAIVCAEQEPIDPAPFEEVGAPLLAVVSGPCRASWVRRDKLWACTMAIMMRPGDTAVTRSPMADESLGRFMPSQTRTPSPSSCHSRVQSYGRPADC